MSWFENFRQQNQHLFGEDGDFSDSEPEFEPGENEEIKEIYGIFEKNSEKIFF